eukprot:5783204-Pyramimonas_sp.AAC.1
MVRPPGPPVPLPRPRHGAAPWSPCTSTGVALDIIVNPSIHALVSRLLTSEVFSHLVNIVSLGRTSLAALVCRAD